MDVTMDFRRLGNSELLVSRICLGAMSFGDPKRRAWTLDEADSRSIVRVAVDAGINFFDTANSYMMGESERILGGALADLGSRDNFVIASKVGLPVGPAPEDRGLSRRHIATQVEGSLRRLRTDYLDLYQIHRWDYQTPIEETLTALDDLVQAGKVRYIGASSMFAWQLARAQCLASHLGLATFVSMQAQYNLAYREEEREMIPLCQSEDIGLIPWSPLARGFLSGTRKREGFGDTIRARTDDLEHKRYHGPVDFAILDRVCGVAARINVTPAQVALAWLMGKPIVAAPIVGATRPEHILEAVKAAQLSLTSEEVLELEEPYQPRAINDHD
jgi:aryl-alcohol dehydrogenase (NADP+)